MKVEELARLLHDAHRHVADGAKNGNAAEWEQLGERWKENRREMARYILSRCKVIRERP